MTAMRLPRPAARSLAPRRPDALRLVRPRALPRRGAAARYAAGTRAGHPAHHVPRAAGRARPADRGGAGPGAHRGHRAHGRGEGDAGADHLVAGKPRAAGPDPERPGAARATRGSHGASRRRRSPARTPAVAVLSHSIHGNEPAGFEAAMQTAYQLLASDEPATLEILRNVVTILNPSQNPDGHERFAAWNNSVAVPTRRARRAGADRAVECAGPVQSLPVRHEPRLRGPVASWRPGRCRR